MKTFKVIEGKKDNGGHNEPPTTERPSKVHGQVDSNTK